MDEDLKKLEAVLAKSNLTATAGEFIPRSQQLETNHNGYPQHQDLYNNQQHDSNFSNPVNGSTPDQDQAIPGSSRDPDVQYSGRLSVKKNDFGRYYQKGNYPRNDVYFANNRDPKWSRNNKWKKPETSENRDIKNGKKYNALGFDQFNEGDGYSQNKYFNRNREKMRHYGNNYFPNSNFEKNKRYPRNDQFSNYKDENVSWRKRDTDSDQNQQFHFEGAQLQSSEVAVSNDKNSSSKFHGKYKSKDVFQKKDTSGSDQLVEDVKASQKEQLIDMLTQGTLECLVCCEPIHQNASVWSCNNCYHVFHLKCIIKWAKSSKSDFGWRCPACQNVTAKVPYEYFCFCGKVRNPEWNHQDCPHSCGETCGRTRKKSCPHKCTLLCHPGPCSQCTATIQKKCGCGRTSKTVQCSSSEIITCHKVCRKIFGCIIHECTRKCHPDDCGDCGFVKAQDCYCGKEHREVNCTMETLFEDFFSCGNICQKQLTCENHICTLTCHEDDCPECEFTPERVKYCPCGKTQLSSLNVEVRKSCKDPVPTCDLICGKQLPCSQPGNIHVCQSKCHEGDCPVCPLETTLKCTCGHMHKQIPCSELNTPGEVRCDRRCTKKRSCGKHKCNQVCCTGENHECPLPCNRMLQCGLHRCEETCHKGHCKPCLLASFDELSCECGAEVIFPPVPCGTRRPSCNRPCTRVHSCEHPPTHNCHSDNQCPPCTVLTKKYCHGRHELRKAVPCHQESFSCGLPCGKEIECGRHKCILPCHSGPCLKSNQPCVQPCTVPRPICGHICASPCHDGPCPTDTLCKETVRVTCECGHRFTTKPCYENMKECQRLATAKLATKVSDMQSGQSIDLNDVENTCKKLSYKTLECNEECKLIERNRRLAIALQIRNPDLSAKLTPRYSEYLKNWAKRDARFCQMVHDKLTDLVQLAKQSKQKSRSYSFDPMNREKRHFIHEYCEHFGCESVAYDQEPKRNVVATAVKDRSWLPSMSVVELVHKENSPRKVPAPVIAKSIPSTSKGAMEVLPSKILPNHSSDSTEETPNSTSESQIDYFDWRPQNS